MTSFPVVKNLTCGVDPVFSRAVSRDKTTRVLGPVEEAVEALELFFWRQCRRFRLRARLRQRSCEPVASILLQRRTMGE